MISVFLLEIFTKHFMFWIRLRVDTDESFLSFCLKDIAILQKIVIAFIIELKEMSHWFCNNIIKVDDSDIVKLILEHISVCVWRARTPLNNYND